VVSAFPKILVKCEEGVHMGAWRGEARGSGSSLSLALNCSKIKSIAGRESREV